MPTVYCFDGTDWKVPIAISAFKSDGTWGTVKRISIFRNGAWEGLSYTLTSTDVSSLSKAAVGLPAYVAFWSVLINGRKVGDIDNDGTLSVDFSWLSQYIAGTLSNQSRIDWIEQQIIPYLTFTGGLP
jgi:hypothetical protein